jgi:hypothetical protein
MVKLDLVMPRIGWRIRDVDAGSGHLRARFVVKNDFYSWNSPIAWDNTKLRDASATRRRPARSAASELLRLQSRRRPM